MRKIKSKKAAIEMSMTTIIVIVLSLTLLIFGFVFVRSIMCTAIGLTDSIGDKAGDEINKLFGASGGEVVCIGEGSPISMAPGETNIVYCGVNAPELQRYRFDIEPNRRLSSQVVVEFVDNWFISTNFDREIAPGDEAEKQIARVVIPDDAPEGDLVFDLDVFVDGRKKFTKTLNYKITRTGIIRSAIC
jgi:hypothetical protein